MDAAVAAVTSGKMSVREASRTHGVPRTTLQRKLSRGCGPSAGAGDSGAEEGEVKREAADATSGSGSESSGGAAGRKRRVEQMERPAASKGGERTEELLVVSAA